MGVSSGRRPARRKFRAAGAVLALVATLLGATMAASPAGGEEPAVRTVLFFSPTCPHCHQVISEDLPPLQTRFGGRLQILMVDVSAPGGSALYDAAVTQFTVPQERIGVPTLVVGDVVLVGSVEIPELLPSLVERLLASGGSDWPPIPGLVDVLPTPAASAPAAPAAPAAAVLPAASPLSYALERVARDPLGNAMAIGVLLGLLFSLAWVAVAMWRARARAASGSPSGWIPVIALAGLAVAGYLSAVEMTGTSAVCGPVGNCNLVHQSEYARLFGLPIGLLGFAGYASILGCWFVSRRATGRPVLLARSALFGLAVAGTLFSVYLTFLEPFVLGATCAWCLASAVLMDAALLLATASMWPRRSTARSTAT